MCLYREGDIGGYDSMNLAYQKFCVHKKGLQERDRKIYAAMQPLLDDVEMFIKTAMTEIDKKENKSACEKIGEITPAAERYRVSLSKGNYVIVNSSYDAELLSKELKKYK